MSAQLDALRLKVQGFLSPRLSLGLEQDGSLTVVHGSTKTWVKCWEPENGDVQYVKIECPLLFGVPPTPELFKYIALHSDDYIFGHLWCSESENGILVLFTHNLLGNYLDEDELWSGVAGIASVAEELDDELQAKFGGRKFRDD